MTEEHSEKAFGSMQEARSDRSPFRKSIWINAGGIGVTEEHLNLDPLFFKSQFQKYCAKILVKTFIGERHMWAFIVVVLVLFLIPGPAVLLTLTQTVKGGLKAGIITGVGIAVGDLIHTIAAVLGLSAILMTSALAFEVVKYLGAAYLIFLGVKALFEKQEDRNIRK